MQAIPQNAYSWTPSTGLSSSTIANPVASPGSTTTYSVIVTNPNGCSPKRKCGTLNVNPTQTLTGASQHEVVCAGSGAVIDVAGLLPGSTSTIAYSISGVAQTPVTGVIADASGNASFTTANLVTVNNGQTLQITGITITGSTPSCAKSFAQNVTLAVNTAPAITIQPTNQTTTYGTPVSFSVEATGSPTPTYQWQINIGEG